MQSIKVLSDETIDRIAAGEVVERPLNVVKELVENSIDAGSTIIHVEIKNGGTELIRVTDNGAGIPSSEVKTAFLRHATSKLRTIDDFDSLLTMGFRGEALSSICSVSKTEMITKTREDLLGTKINIDGGKLSDFCQVGAPDGTTIIVRSLFYNTPARKKFLKSATTEAAMVEDMVEKMALSHPEIAFQFTLNGKLKIQTNGNGQLKDCIYRIFGKEIYSRLLPIEFENEVFKISGFLAKPEYSSSLRNEEICFVNSRFVKSRVLNIAIEEGYKGYLMQHRFPFCVLMIETSPLNVDVNVHPQKLEVRFSNNEIVNKTISEAIKLTLKEPELIPVVKLVEDSDEKADYKNGRDNNHTPDISNFNQAKETIDDNNKLVTERKAVTTKLPEFEEFSVSFDDKRNLPDLNTEDISLSSNKSDLNQNITSNSAKDYVSKSPYLSTPELVKPSEYKPREFETVIKVSDETVKYSEVSSYEPFEKNTIVNLPKEEHEKPTQINLFEDRLISDEPLKEYKIIGQVFDTYWIITLKDNMYIVDQHAAHEKVNYERFLSYFESKTEVSSQMVMPAISLHLTAKQADVLANNIDIFTKIGFEIEDFGQNSFAVRSVPENLYGVTVDELFMDILDELTEKESIINPTVVLEKLASMSCKAAVKGNNRLSYEEMSSLMKELMSLENPYNCPHGRPVFIQITQKELEKKFKRIV